MKIRIRFQLAPGDMWCFTAFLKDFCGQHPEHQIEFNTFFPEVYLNNPNFHYFRSDPDMDFKFTFQDACGLKRWRFGNTKTPENMAQCLYDFVEKKTGIHTERKTLFVDWYPTENEKKLSVFSPEKPVCLVNASYKDDNKNKFWGLEKFQAVIDALKDKVLFVQVGAKESYFNHNSRLKNCQSMIGHTSLRELAHLVYHADFILTGISQLLPLSAIQTYKPRHCITIAGAREPEQWANCWRQDNVTFHWIGNNADFMPCMEAIPNRQEKPGCWLHECDKTPSPCMEAIKSETIIKIFEEVLNEHGKKVSENQGECVGVQASSRKRRNTRNHAGHEAA